MTTKIKEKQSYRDTNVPMEAVSEFDAERYLGTWYELARYPHPQVNDCTAPTLKYSLREDGNIRVENSCHIGEPNGPLRKAEGMATLEGPGKLNVKFRPEDNDPEPDYWVIGLKPDYSMAVVGNPPGTSGWVLCREKECSDEDMSWAKGILEKYGYDLSKLEMTPHK